MVASEGDLLSARPACAFRNIRYTYKNAYEMILAQRTLKILSVLSGMRSCRIFEFFFLKTMRLFASINKPKRKCGCWFADGVFIVALHSLNLSFKTVLYQVRLNSSARVNLWCVMSWYRVCVYIKYNETLLCEGNFVVRSHIE